MRASAATHVLRLCTRQTGSHTYRVGTNVCASSSRFVSQQPHTLYVRSFTSTRHYRQENVQALVGYAFAGKPRQTQQELEEEERRQAEQNGDSSDSPSSPSPSTASTNEPVVRQGFPEWTSVGQWVDDMLKKGDAGEDMLAVTAMRGKGDLLLAVADGVGGWSENGVDPALFSQSLMYHASQYAKQFYACPDRIGAEDMANDAHVEASTSSPELIGTPFDILNVAHQNVEKQKEVMAGSSTACVLTFDASKGILRAANLGDSGFLVLRPRKPSKTTAPPPAQLDADNESSSSDSDASEEEAIAAQSLHEIHYQSHAQLHGFNTPYQLSKLPPAYRSADSIESVSKDAHQSETHVREGDIVLLATDGFWDNVSSSEILQLVAFIRQKHHVAWQKERDPASLDDPLAEERNLANVLAHNLLQYTLMCQFSTNKTSPFEREARRYGIHFPGGKVDDVSIVAALIVER